METSRTPALASLRMYISIVKPSRKKRLNAKTTITS